MALPTVVTDFLTRLKDSLSQGSDLGSSARGAAQNYLLAQDMATALDLLQDAMDTSVALTATGGSTTTVVDGAATFTAGEQVGNYVVFESDTTTVALRGLEFRILGNSATTLTVEQMPAAAASGDTYQIRGAYFDEQIAQLRDGLALADAPRGSVYGDVRVVMDALATGIRRLGGTVPVRSVGLPGLQTGAGSTTTEVVLDLQGGSARIDQFRGYEIVVSGQEPRRIVSSDEAGVVTVSRAYASAPSASTAVTLRVAEDRPGGPSAPQLRTHPGAQPGENAMLALHIGTLEALLDSYTLPS